MGRKIDVTFDRERDVLRALRALFLPDDGGRAPASKAAAYLTLLAQAYGPLPPRPFVSEPPLVRALAFDASGLTALACGDVSARAYLARGVGSLARIVVPATALLDGRVGAVAEAVADVVDVDGTLARAASRLAALAPPATPFDALLVACAAREESCGIVTADRPRLEALVGAADRATLYLFGL